MEKERGNDEVNLPEFRTVDKKTADNGDILYVLEPVFRPTVCEECGSSLVYVHKSAERKVQDLDVFGHRVGLLINGKTYRCNNCKALIRPKYQSLDGRMTVRLEHAIAEDSFVHTFAETAKRYHVTDTTVATIFNQTADKEMESYTFVAPQVLGIDEVHLEDEYRGVFVAVSKDCGRVLEFTRERTKKSVIRTLESMEEKDNLKLVTIDMWKSYKEAVNEILPGVPIVIDHFHVIKALIEAMDGARSSICREIREHKERISLKHNRFLMLQNNEELSTKQNRRLNDLFTAYPQLETVYLLKEAFRDIYGDCKSSDEARTRFNEWITACHDAEVASFDGFIATVNEWDKEIFAYFDYPDLERTNAQTESMNRCIRDIARNGRGYSFDTLRKKVILRKYVYEPTTKFSFDAFDDRKE